MESDWSCAGSGGDRDVARVCAHRAKDRETQAVSGGKSNPSRRMMKGVEGTRCL